MESKATEFPDNGILPKQDTQALDFIKNTGYNGAGSIVAIFDTGVDPGVEGLQRTPEGLPKVIDIVDTTGSGDVDTSFVAKASDDGKLTGLSGRTLLVPEDWTNPTGEYHLGIKRAFELYPKSLATRVKKERAEAWEEKQRAAVADAQLALAACPASPTTAAGRKSKANARAAVSELAALQGAFDDPGPVYDCVVFYDGQAWQSAVDTTETGDLSKVPLQTDYRVAQQWSKLDERSQLNFGVNIYDEGATLSIVCDAGAHGTHVAGIVAAFYEDSPELNGIAPGAQIVGVKIGDTRLGSMETGAGLIRGIIAARRAGVDLINMSYGEPAAEDNTGRFVSLVRELVNDDGVIFVSSAGNEGPALSSSGAPGATSDCMISVGAYVSPPMMRAEYSMREMLPAINYSWTSRGPTFDGDLGVCVSAPGGAISPVPTWTLQRNMMMNGTSMAAPNTCGALALLVSALKAQGVGYTPHRIRRAIENSAQAVAGVEVWAQGHGLLQVMDAYNHILATAADSNHDVRYNVTIPARGARGVYLRHSKDTSSPQVITVRVDPQFHKLSLQQPKLDFSQRFSLVCSQRWVTAPAHFMLMHGGRSFSVCVDPTQLPPGPHYAEIVAYDSASADHTPVFRVPITVTKPQPLEVAPSSGSICDMGQLTFRPGQIHRRFFTVPGGATWADFSIRGGDSYGGDGGANSRLYMFHAVHSQKATAFHNQHRKKSFWMRADEQQQLSTATLPGETLEVCIAQYWNSLGDSSLKLVVTFRGITPSPSALTFVPGSDTLRVDVCAALCTEQLQVAASLTSVQKVIPPDAYGLPRPLRGDRDMLPGGRQIYCLDLTYSFSLDASTAIFPRFPRIQGQLYESPLGSQLIMIFDSRKRHLHTSDVWPDDYAKTLPKGKYTLKLRVRHDDVTILDGLAAISLVLECKLPKAVSLTAYPTRANATTRSNKLTWRKLPVGSSRPLFLAAPAYSRLKGVKPGDVLVGTITYGKSNEAFEGSSKRPGGFPLSYVVPPAPPKAPPASPSPPAPKAGPLTEDEELRDLRIKRLTALSSKDGFLAEYARLCELYPGHLELLQAGLSQTVKQGDTLASQDVLAACNAVIAAVDCAALAAHYGTNLDKADEQQAAARKICDKQRDALAQALYYKARAQAAALSGAGDGSAGPQECKEADASSDDNGDGDGSTVSCSNIVSTVSELRKWVKLTDSKYALAAVDKEVALGHHAVALQKLRKVITTVATATSAPHAHLPPLAELEATRQQLLQALGWNHWVQYFQSWKPLLDPLQHRPF